MQTIITLKPGSSVTLGDTTYDSECAIPFSNDTGLARQLFGEAIARIYTDREWQGPEIQRYPRGWVPVNPVHLNQPRSKRTMTTTKEISLKKPENAITRAQKEVETIIGTLEEQVLDKEENYKGLVYDASEKEGYETCRDVCKELRPLRANIEKVRKELKKPINLLGKQVDAGAKTLLERMDSLIEPAQAAYRAEDERKQKEEEARISKAQNAMDWMRGLCNNAMMADSAKITEMIEKLESKELEPELFQELLADATNLKEQTLQSLRMALQLKQQAEEQQRQLEEQQKQMAEMQRKQQASEPQQEEPSPTQAEATATEEVAPQSVTEAGSEKQKYLTPPSKRQPAKKVSYQHLQQWPSDQDRADNDQLDDICNKLEEAETYIDYLHAQINKAEAA